MRSFGSTLFWAAVVSGSVMLFSLTLTVGLAGFFDPGFYAGWAVLTAILVILTPIISKAESDFKKFRGEEE